MILHHCLSSKIRADQEGNLWASFLTSINLNVMQAF
jgi:hypothetical protein